MHLQPISDQHLLHNIPLSNPSAISFTSTTACEKLSESALGNQHELLTDGLLFCADMKMLSYDRLNSVIEQLVVIMAKKRQEKQVGRSLFVSHWRYVCLKLLHKNMLKCHIVRILIFMPSN